MSKNPSNLSEILVQHLESDKEKFLTKLGNKINKKISSKTPAQCLQIITTRNGKSVRWQISDGVPYVERLIAYLRKKDFKEDGRTYKVDSALTGEIMEVVTKQLTQEIQRHQELISDIVIVKILMNDATQRQFVNTISRGKTAKAINAKAKSMIVGALLSGLREKLKHFSEPIAQQMGEKVTHTLAIASKSTIVTSTQHLAAKVIATTAGKIILSKLAIVIGKSLAPILTKLIAMPAIKIILNKIIIGAIISSLANIISAKLGMGLAGALAVILIPLILGFLIHDIVTLPDKLGTSIADAITKDLKDDYAKTMKQIVIGIIADLTSEKAVEELGKGLSKDEEFTSRLVDLVDMASESLMD